MDTVRRLIALVGIVLGAGAGGLAHADVPPADKALATALFQQARGLMEAGQTHAACEGFAESQRLDPGGGTLLNLARCHEAEGKTGTAWAEFNEALAWSHRDGRPDREAFATEHIAALERRLARIQIDVAASSDAEGLEVRRDGTLLGRATWGALFPVDPGPHIVEASAPGRLAWRAEIEVLSGQSRAVAVPPLVVGPAASNAVLAPAGGPVAASRSSSGPSVRTAGYATAAAGIVLLGVGTYFGLHAMSLQSKSDAGCIGTRCSPEGAAYEDSARRASDVSTVTFIAGAATVATGASLLLFAPRAHVGRQLGLVLSSAGGALVGTF